MPHIVLKATLRFLFLSPFYWWRNWVWRNCKLELGHTAVKQWTQDLSVLNLKPLLLTIVPLTRLANKWIAFFFFLLSQNSTKKVIQAKFCQTWIVQLFAGKQPNGLSELSHRGHLFWYTITIRSEQINWWPAMATLYWNIIMQMEAI